MSNVFSGIVRLSADSELKYLPSGVSVLNFNAASSTGFGDKQKTLWLRVAFWRNPEKIQEYLKKGTQCFISGELTQREYQANDGTTKASLELNANILDLVGGKREGAPDKQPAPQDNFDAPYDDDIPF